MYSATDKIKQRINGKTYVHTNKHRPLLDGFRNYYWIVGKDSGKRVILGAYVSYDEADRDGFANFKDYEVVTLTTRDRAAAREQIRKRVLDETHNVEETFQRFKHMYRSED